MTSYKYLIIHELVSGIKQFAVEISPQLKRVNFSLNFGQLLKEETLLTECQIIALEFSWNLSWFWCSTIYLCDSQSINNLCYLYSYNTFESDDGIPSPRTHCNIFFWIALLKGSWIIQKKIFLTFQVRDECQIWDTQSVHMLKGSQRLMYTVH